MAVIGKGVSSTSNSLRPGYSAINKFGVNTDIDTATDPEDIWSHGGLFPFLDTGIAMDLVSDSPNDTLAGTGAQKVKVTYYETDNTEHVEEYDMDGLSRVQILTNPKISTRIEVIQTGSSNTNEGEINLVDRATGLVVYQSVEIGEGQTLSAVQIIPKDKQGEVRCHSLAYAKIQSPFSAANMRLFVRKTDGTLLAKHATVISSTKPDDNIVYAAGGISVDEGEIVFWRCQEVAANDTPVEARFDLEIWDK